MGKKELCVYEISVPKVGFVEAQLVVECSNGREAEKILKYLIKELKSREVLNRTKSSRGYSRTVMKRKKHIQKRKSQKKGGKRK